MRSRNVCRHGDDEWQSTDRCVIRMMKQVVSDTRVFFDAVLDGLLSRVCHGEPVRCWWSLVATRWQVRCACVCWRGTHVCPLSKLRRSGGWRYWACIMCRRPIDSLPTWRLRLLCRLYDTDIMASYKERRRWGRGRVRHKTPVNNMETCRRWPIGSCVNWFHRQ